MAFSRRRVFVVGAAGLAAAAAAAVLAPRLRNSSAQALETARFTDLEGRPRTLAEWKNRPLVCNFWATWCPPCREEIPLLVAERPHVTGKGGEIVGIALDTAANVAQFTKTVHISYPVLLADPSSIELMAKLGNASGGLPYTVFVARSGRIAGRKLGRLQRPELEARLRELLAS